VIKWELFPVCSTVTILVVNCVMATEIADKGSDGLRKRCWEKASNIDETSTTRSMSESTMDDVNRKVTIVIEHLIQASDESHACCTGTCTWSGLSGCSKNVKGLPGGSSWEGSVRGLVQRGRTWVFDFYCIPFEVTFIIHGWKYGYFYHSRMKVWLYFHHPQMKVWLLSSFTDGINLPWKFLAKKCARIRNVG
jgi:hypothetical protein